MAKNSPKKIATNNAWTNAHYDRVNLALPKGQKEVIQAAAAASGEKSVNAWIGKAIETRLSGVAAPTAPAESEPVENVVPVRAEDMERMNAHLELHELDRDKFMHRAIQNQIKSDLRARMLGVPIDREED